MTRIVFGVEVHGVDVDAETRCHHYHAPVDRVAIQFPCCGRFYPCHQCHEEVADHPAKTWPADRFSELAVLCGGCGHRLSIDEYRACDSACPSCARPFNPGCKRHEDLYFQVAGAISKQAVW